MFTPIQPSEKLFKEQHNDMKDSAIQLTRTELHYTR